MTNPHQHIYDEGLRDGRAEATTEIERLRESLSIAGLWRDLGEENKRLRSAIDTFSKAVSMPGGPSLAVQRHGPSWEAWKRLCAALGTIEQLEQREG